MPNGRRTCERAESEEAATSSVILMRTLLFPSSSRTISSLQLEYFASSSPGHWVTVTDIGLREKYLIEGLKGDEDAVLMVVVRARNEHGLSLPSPAAKIARGQQGDKKSSSSYSSPDWTSPPMELLGAKAIGPEKIRVEWKVYKYKSLINSSFRNL